MTVRPTNNAKNINQWDLDVDRSEKLQHLHGTMFVTGKTIRLWTSHTTWARAVLCEFSCSFQFNFLLLCPLHFGLHFHFSFGLISISVAYFSSVSVLFQLNFSFNLIFDWSFIFISISMKNWLLTKVSWERIFCSIFTWRLFVLWHRVVWLRCHHCRTRLKGRILFKTGWQRQKCITSLVKIVQHRLLFLQILYEK